MFFPSLSLNNPSNPFLDCKHAKNYKPYSMNQQSKPSDCIEIGYNMHILTVAHAYLRASSRHVLMCNGRCRRLADVLLLYMIMQLGESCVGRVVTD